MTSDFTGAWTHDYCCGQQHKCICIMNNYKLQLFAIGHDHCHIALHPAATQLCSYIGYYQQM